MARRVGGVGVGLRAPHIATVLETRPALPFFEIVSDNWMHPGPVLRERLDHVAEEYPLVLHGVGMNLGSADALDRDYLAALGHLIARYEPELISDHLCWIGVHGRSVPDLLPLPFDKTTLRYLTERIEQVQEALGRRILIENTSAYVAFEQSELQEWEFLSELASNADCDILLDINNVFVNAHNFGFDPERYLQALPPERIKQIHLAGHEDWEGVLVDTHSQPTRAEVLALYTTAIRRFGPVPTLVEWDRDLPDFDVLLNEARKAEQSMHAALT